MAIEPGLKTLTLWLTPSLGANITFFTPTFNNSITIRRFKENVSAITTGTTALTITDGGTDGTGSTAIASKVAAAWPAAAVTQVTTPAAVNAMAGYYLGAGKCIKVAIVQATAALIGYIMTMEYVEGAG